MTDRELMQMALPCPFCGSDKVVVEEGSTFRWVFACCDNCDAKAGEVRKQTIGAGTPQQWHEEAQRRAIEEWNKRARIAQPEPEPVVIDPDDTMRLLKHSPKREWQGLTDGERRKVWNAPENLERPMDFARAIEARLKEKNT